MRKKLLEILSAGVLVVGMLAGCGSDATPVQENSQQTVSAQNQSVFDMSAKDAVISVITETGRNPDNLPAPVEDTTSDMKKVSVTVSDGLEVIAFASDGKTSSLYIVMDGASDADTDTFLEYGQAIFDVCGCGDKFNSTTADWQSVDDMRYALITDNDTLKIMYAIETVE